MATEIKTFEIIDGKLVPVKSSLAKEGRTETKDLEQWIKTNPEILGDDIAVIGEQVQTASGPVDFLGVDSTGNIVIIELKRDQLPREAIVQAIDYASDISNWEPERFREICQSFSGKPFEDYFQEKFEDISSEDLAINQAQRLLLVGFSVEESLSRMIEWLSDKYNMGINAVILNYVKTSKGNEVISRTVIIPEEVVKQKTNIKKFIIEKSDEPGNYDSQTLEEKLIGYLSRDLYSARRIRDVLLPLLLQKGMVTRDELRKEFVRVHAADNEGDAGYFISLISNQLGHKWKDYLRQVISYEYPNHYWEKDNFVIPDEYKELVGKVLNKLKDTNK